MNIEALDNRKDALCDVLKSYLGRAIFVGHGQCPAAHTHLPSPQDPSLGICTLLKVGTRNTEIDPFPAKFRNREGTRFNGRRGIRRKKDYGPNLLPAYLFGNTLDCPTFA